MNQIHPHKKDSRLIWLAVTLAAGVIFLGHGCGKFADVNPIAGQFGLGSSTDEFIPIPGEKTVGTVYANQVLDNFVSCTGIGGESSTTRGVWEDRKGSLSEFGYATKVSGPMQMAITSIAGEICQDLVDQDQARDSSERFVFQGFDFSAQPSRLPSSADILDSSERLALSCWQRRLDEVERRTLLDMMGNSLSGAALNAREVQNSALLICTSILASLSAIEQ